MLETVNINKCYDIVNIALKMLICIVLSFNLQTDTFIDNMENLTSIVIIEQHTQLDSRLSE